MRILMLTQFYPPIVGGIERHVRDLSTELVRRGHSVAVATLWQEGLPEYEVEKGIRIYRIRGTVHRAAKALFQNPNQVYAPPFPDPELVLALRRVITCEHPQIVHAHNWLVYSFLPLKKSSRAKLVVTLHDFGLRCPKWTPIYHDTLCDGPSLRKCIECATGHYGLAKGTTIVLGSRIMNRLERNAVDMFLPVSEAVASGTALVGSRLPFETIPNFIPDKLNAVNGDITAYLSQLPDKGYLIFVGAFGKHKGVDVLLRTYAQLNTSVSLVLIGYEIPGFSLESLTIPTNVFVFKNWPNSAVMEALARSSIAIFPSTGPEACPTVALEAMSVNRPVIASRIGGTPDLVTDAETGILVPPGDSDSLRQAIEHLLDNPILRDQMGQRGKQNVANFQASHVVPRIEQIYHKLVGISD